MNAEVANEKVLVDWEVCSGPGRALLRVRSARRQAAPGARLHPWTRAKPAVAGAYVGRGSKTNGPRNQIKFTK